MHSIAWWKLLVFGLFIGLTCKLQIASAQTEQGVSPTPYPQPVGDRMAIPVLPEHPTQIEIGSSVYYYNCMPCHGDRGQGLTGEWRQAWVEDHRNCWERGCHGGRIEDEGFPLTRVVPAVSGSGALDRFPTPGDLFAYLQATHPPQRPGRLAEADYWAAAAYILSLSNRINPGESIGPQSETAQPSFIVQLVVAAATVVVVGAALVWQRSPNPYSEAVEEREHVFPRS